jgi:hypothetical protein
MVSDFETLTITPIVGRIGWGGSNLRIANKPSPPQGAGYLTYGFCRFYRRKRRGIQPIEIKLLLKGKCMTSKKRSVNVG